MQLEVGSHAWNPGLGFVAFGFSICTHQSMIAPHHSHGKRAPVSFIWRSTGDSSTQLGTSPNKILEADPQRPLEVWQVPKFPGCVCSRNPAPCGLYMVELLMCAGCSTVGAGPTTFRFLATLSLFVAGSHHPKDYSDSACDTCRGPTKDSKG